MSVQTAKTAGRCALTAAKIGAKLAVAALPAMIIKEATFKENITKSRLTNLEYRIPIISICSYAIYALLRSTDKDLNRPCAKTINFLASPLLKKVKSLKAQSSSNLAEKEKTN